MPVLTIDNLTLDAQAEKAQLIHALRTHRIRTLTELRRVERIFASLGSPDLTEPMTSACNKCRNSDRKERLGG